MSSGSAIIAIAVLESSMRAMIVVLLIRKNLATPLSVSEIISQLMQTAVVYMISLRNSSTNQKIKYMLI